MANKSKILQQSLSTSLKTSQFSDKERHEQFQHSESWSWFLIIFDLPFMLQHLCPNGLITFRERKMEEKGRENGEYTRICVDSVERSRKRFARHVCVFKSDTVEPCWVCFINHFESSKLSFFSPLLLLCLDGSLVLHMIWSLLIQFVWTGILPVPEVSWHFPL